MFLLYSLIIGLFDLIVRIVSLFNHKARLFVKGRNNQFSKVEQQLKAWADKKKIWVHVSSYGEFEMARPLIEHISRYNGDIKFVISFFSPSGYERINLDEKRFLKIYLPIDYYSRQKKLIQLINPEAVYFIKYDFWFNLLRALKKEAIPYFFISLHFNEDHYLFRNFASPFLKTIKQAHKIYAHSDDALKILNDHGFHNAEAFGDLRLHQVLENKGLSAGVANINWTNPEADCLIYGSVSKFELPYIIDTIKSLKACNHILALHDLEEPLMHKVKAAFPDADYLSKNTQLESNVLVVDTYGDLKYLYKNADAAYIGGAFEKGPHNILEALVHGIPVVTGKNIKKFPLARNYRSRGLIEVIESPEMIKNAMKKCIDAHDSALQNERINSIIADKPEMQNILTDLDVIMTRSKEKK